MKKIGELCKKYNLSRSTLLYYDRIGLLKPTNKTEAGYRLYSQDDEAKLNKICIYRNTGISLEEVHQVLISEHSSQLENRLIELDNEIKRIRIQQKLIVKLMGKKEAEIPSLFTAERFGNLLKSIGMSEEEVNDFHIKLELASTDEHLNFLRFLGLDDGMIEKIINLSRDYIKNNNLS